MSTTTRQTSFSVGRRWLVNERPGKARFWFVILGPGLNYKGNPSATHKLCRLEYHPDDMWMGDAQRSHGHETTYSHQHLKKYATLVENNPPSETNGTPISA